MRWWRPGDYWEMLMPSEFTQPTPALEGLIGQLEIERSEDPLTFLRVLNSAMYTWFDYVPKATRVDSPSITPLRPAKASARTSRIS